MVLPEFDVSIVASNVDCDSSETVVASGILENRLITGDSAMFTNDQLFIYFHIHAWHTRQREVWHQPPTASSGLLPDRSRIAHLRHAHICILVVTFLRCSRLVH